jgi:hypothetical protein
MTAPERPPHNPYAPPAAPPEAAASGGAARGVGREWKWAYLAVSGAALVGYVAVYWSVALGLSSGAIETTRGLIASVTDDDRPASSRWSPPPSLSARRSSTSSPVR